MKRLGVLGVMVFAFACSDSGNGKTDAPKTADAPHDTRSIDGPHADAALDGPPGTQQLTVKNYLSWCSVSVNGGSASAAGTQQVFVQPGPIALAGSAASATFKIDAHMWHHTDGDTSGSGEAGTVNGATSDATVTVGSAAKCVWVCCPFTNGTGCDPATIGEQCP